MFTTRPVARGERFSRANVDVLRHGKLEAGLPPDSLQEVLESVAARDLPAETPLARGDITRSRW